MVSLKATQDFKATAAMAADAKVLGIDKGNGSEVVFGADTVPTFDGGQFVYEVWQGGNRVFTTNVTLPTLIKTVTHDLTDKLDYTLEGALAPLVRNVTSASRLAPGYTAQWTYDASTIPPTGSVDASALKHR